MELSFTAPDPALANYIAAYYHVRVDYPLIEDHERADVGYLRLMFSGTGFYDYRAQRDPDRPVMLLGPASQTAHYIIQGPLDSFGCVLLPEFWGGIVDADASAYANRALDGVPVLGAGAAALFEAMNAIHSGGNVAAMGQMMDAFLIPRIKPVPADHRKVIATIGDWLSQRPILAPDALYSQCDPSSRQVMRLSNRYFGAPPKVLARKFRALRTASRIIGTRGAIPDALADDYADKAHMTREVKHFTGLTPRSLQVNSSPIMQVTLHPDNFRQDSPWK